MHVVDPATEETIAELEQAGVEETDAVSRLACASPGGARAPAAPGRRPRRGTQGRAGADRVALPLNALCPGPVETPLLLAIWGDDPAAAKRRLVHIPMGRLAQPREIVNAALFLASDESPYVNAATFVVVDGGISAAYVTPEESG